MIDPKEAAICGKLSALEFVLEVMLANELADYPESMSKEFLDELVSRPGYISHGPVDADDLNSIKAECQVSLENFAAKVAKRSRGLRAREQDH